MVTDVYFIADVEEDTSDNMEDVLEKVKKMLGIPRNYGIRNVPFYTAIQIKF